MWPNRYPDLIEHIGDPLRVGPHVIRQGDSQQVLVAGQVQHEARPGGGHDGAVSGHGQSPDGGARPGRRGIDGRLDLRIGGQPTGATGRDEPVRDAVADAQIGPLDVEGRQTRVLPPRTCLLYPSPSPRD